MLFVNVFSFPSSSLAFNFIYFFLLTFIHIYLCRYLWIESNKNVHFFSVNALPVLAIGATECWELILSWGATNNFKNSHVNLLNVNLLRFKQTLKRMGMECVVTDNETKSTKICLCRHLLWLLCSKVLGLWHRVCQDIFSQIIVQVEKS